MTDQIRGLNAALGGDAYRTRDFESHAEQAMQIANDTSDWPFSDIDKDLAQRIVAGEYIGRHESAGPAGLGHLSHEGRYAKPDADAFVVPKRRHLRQAQQRILNAVRRSQP